MRPWKIFQWAAVLTLTIAVFPGTATAQTDALKISGLFSMDYLYGTVGSDLAEVYANGQEHSWALTLHGTTQKHYIISGKKATEYFATSYDFVFFGPDAATLNGIASEHLVGGELLVYLWNAGGVAIMYIEAAGSGMDFYTEIEPGVATLFPTDANGYPVVGPEPFSIEPDYTDLFDSRPGNGGGITSLAGLVTFQLVTANLPGDYNNDGLVNLGDYTMWRDNLGAPSGSLVNDPNPGTVGTAQYNTWKANFGNTLPSAAVNARIVPEPGAGVLALLGVGTIFLFRQRARVAFAQGDK